MTSARLCDSAGVYARSPLPLENGAFASCDRPIVSHHAIDEASLMRGLWMAAGGENLWVTGRSPHTIGTCRMGADPAAAVVDPDGRAFDVPNLCISDNSTSPSSLSANPALTIMALALRTGDRYLERLGRREA